MLDDDEFGAVQGIKIGRVNRSAQRKPSIKLTKIHKYTTTKTAQTHISTETSTYWNRHQNVMPCTPPNMLKNLK
jgi:hypothetical protein